MTLRTVLIDFSRGLEYMGQVNASMPSFRSFFTHHSPPSFVKQKIPYRYAE